MSEQYSPDTKAQVMAALMAGQSIGQISREYNIPKGTISGWKNRGTGRGTETQKKEIGDLVLEYLQANLMALRAQANVFTDKTWLEKQEASQLAVLHGVMTDKAIRLLEAMSKDDDTSG